MPPKYIKRYKDPPPPTNEVEHESFRIPEVGETLYIPSNPDELHTVKEVHGTTFTDTKGNECSILNDWQVEEFPF